MKVCRSDNYGKDCKHQIQLDVLSPNILSPLQQHGGGKWGLTVLSFFSSGISVIWILKWGIAVSFSPAVCDISPFWLTVFGKRRSRYCGTVHCPLLFNASLRSRRLDDPSRVSHGTKKRIYRASKVKSNAR